MSLLDLITLDMLGETHERKKTTIAKSSFFQNVMNKKWGYQDHRWDHNKNFHSSCHVKLKETLPCEVNARSLRLKSSSIDSAHPLIKACYCF